MKVMFRAKLYSKSCPRANKHPSSRPYRTLNFSPLCVPKFFKVEPNVLRHRATRRSNRKNFISSSYSRVSNSYELFSARDYY